MLKLEALAPFCDAAFAQQKTLRAAPERFANEAHSLKPTLSISLRRN